MSDALGCDVCQELLVDYHFGELAPELRGRVAHHLGGDGEPDADGCASCAVAYCRLHADLEGIAAAVEVTPGPQVQARLRALVEATFRPPWWRRALSAVRAAAS